VYTSSMLHYSLYDGIVIYIVQAQAGLQVSSRHHRT
jgi:hypothetical protein